MRGVFARTIAIPALALGICWGSQWAVGGFVGKAEAVNLKTGTGRALLLSSGAVICSGDGLKGPCAAAWVLCANGLPGPCSLANAASVDCDLANGRYWYSNALQGSCPITTTRASGGTNLLPTSASGFAYATFGNNAARITAGSGILIEESRTNQLFPSVAPSQCPMQTTASLGTGTYTNWINGSGSALVSGGTATITGAAPATNGSPNVFTVTVAGTVVWTPTGTVIACQIEAGSLGTSLIVTVGAPGTRAADNITFTNPLLSAMSPGMFSLITLTGPFNNTNFPTLVYFSNANNVVIWTSNTTFFGRTGGSNNASATLGNGGYATTSVKSNFTATASSHSAVGNNGTVATNANPISTLPVTSAGFGGGPVGTSTDGYYERETLFVPPLTDSILKALSQ